MRTVHEILTEEIRVVNFGKIASEPKWAVKIASVVTVQSGMRYRKAEQSAEHFRRWLESIMGEAVERTGKLEQQRLA